MKQFLILTIVVLFFTSCKGEKDKVIDLNSVIPSSEKYNDDVKIDTLSKVDDTLSSLFDRSLVTELNLSESTLQWIESSFLPERFASKSIVKLALKSEVDSISFLMWTYKDSLKTMNAFYNWLDCFGPKCKALKYRESINFQREAMLLFVSDTAIVYISTRQKLKPESWQKYLELRYGIKEWDNVVAQSRGGKAVWSTFEKKKFLPIEK
ncbi:MAG: hypothetical protein V4638_07975 [Bacteroidota bacterium]